MLIISSSVDIEPGSFGLRVSGGTLQVPGVLASILVANRVLRANQLLPFLRRSRSHVAKLLGWSLDQVDAAIGEAGSSFPDELLAEPCDHVESFGLQRR